MTVKELVEQLQTFPQDHKVFVSSDEEGNQFSALSEAVESYFVDEGSRYENYSVHPEDAKDPDLHEEEPGKAVILWP